MTLFKTKRKPLIWQIFLPFMLTIAISLVAVTWYASSSLRNFYISEIASDLQTTALLTEEIIAGRMSTSQRTQLDQLCKDLGKKSETRITVILPSGQVIADSHESPQEMDNHADRPEVITALTGKPGKQKRHSETLDRNMLYVAVPIISQGEIAGVIRTSVSLSSIDNALIDIYIKIALRGLVIALIAAMISLVIARKISKPLVKMKKGAELFAKGDLTHKLEEPDSLEIGGLAQAMNQMARELDERIQSILTQREEQQAVLSSMVEGVIAINSSSKVLSINDAAAGLIGIDRMSANGMTLHQLIKDTDIQKLVEQATTSNSHVEGHVLLGGQKKFFRLHMTSLRNGQHYKIGDLIVLNDITRIRHLEKVRSDFVANVSHELKTPITSIKGFVETLLDGAINDPNDAQRFIEIIARQTNRLSNIIEDLLTLSRIEQQTEATEVGLEHGQIKPVISAAVQLCSIKAGKKGITIETDCDRYLSANINSSMLEQAIVNLVDNAIKYSNDNSTVEINAAQQPDSISITVTDHGCGIEEKYLPRLFERFYRVDKARSRKLGGTGLGLAIVKHIANAHNGTVSAQSQPDQGSTFTITLPSA